MSGRTGCPTADPAFQPSAGYPEFYSHEAIIQPGLLFSSDVFPSPCVKPLWVSCSQTVLLAWHSFFLLFYFITQLGNSCFFRRKVEYLIATVVVLCLDFFLPSLSLFFCTCLHDGFEVNPFVKSLHGGYRESLPSPL